MNKKSNILGYLPSIVLYVVLIIISGIGTAIQFGFDLKEVIWNAFLISFVLRLMLNVFSKYIGADLCFQIYINKSYVLTPKKDFTLLSQSIDYGNFESWITSENLKTKIGLYKEKKQKQLNAVNDKLRKISLLIIKDKHNRKKIKYENKKKIIEAESTEAYINENIAYLKLTYKKLNAKDFETESELTNSTNNSYSFNASWETTKAISKGVPIMIFTALFGGLLSYNISMGQINALSMCYDLATILWFAINGFHKIGKANIQKLIGVFNQRKTVLSRYINETPADRSKAFNLLLILKKEKTLKDIEAEKLKAEEQPKENPS